MSPAQSAPTDRQIRVFVSSTFRDMHAERDHLVTVVFPELRERVERLGLEFFDVDLRWGVPDKDVNGETANSWEYCRQWIDRVEPLFVCILGQRYGWVPEVADFKSADDKARQAITPRSITDLEVRHAVLNDRRKRRSYFYLRETPVPSLPYRATAEQRKIHDEFVDPPTRLRRLNALQSEIRQSGRPVRSYGCRWTGRGFADVEAFGRLVLDDLWSGLLRDSRYVSKTVWRRALGGDPDADPRYTDESQPVEPDLAEKIVTLAKPAPLAPLDAERNQMEVFAAARLKWFQARTDELKLLSDFIDSTGNDAPRLAIVGAVAGQGKSALLAKLSTLIPQPATFLITHFIGATERSASAHALVQRLLDELAASGIDWPEEKADGEPKHDFNSSCAQLTKRLGQYAGQRRIVLLIDALNQLSDGHDLHWLPTRLGPSVRVVVSCASDPATKEGSPEQSVLNALDNRQAGSLRISLGPLKSEDVRTIVVDYFKEYCKELDVPVVKALSTLPQARNPLYLFVALGELRTLGGNEVNRKVPELIASLPRNHPDTVSLFKWALQRLEAFGSAEVKHWCLYLVLGRVGMASRELADLLKGKLGATAGPRALLIERGLRRYLLRRGRQLDFFHGQLKQAVMEKYGSPMKNNELHSDIATYFRNLADPEGDHSWKGNNPRPFLYVAFHLSCAGAQRLDELCQTLCDFRFIETRCNYRQVLPLISDYRLAQGSLSEAQATKTLSAFAQAIEREAETLIYHPNLTSQQLCNRLRFTSGPIGKIVAAELSRQSTQQTAWLELRAPIRESSNLITTFQAHDGPVWNCTVSPDGRLFASVGHDGAARVWATDTFREISTLGHDELAVANRLERLRTYLLDKAHGNSAWVEMIIAVIRKGANRILHCAFDRSGTLFAAKLGSDTLVVWDACNGSELWSSSNFSDFIAQTQIDTSGSVTMTNSGGSMVVVTERDVILLAKNDCFEARSFRDGADLGAWRIRLGGFAVSRDSDAVVVVELDSPGRVFAVDPKTGASALLYRGDGEGLQSCAFVPGTPLIVTGGRTGRITVRDVQTGATVSTRDGHTDGIESCSVSRDGRYLATAAIGSLKIWTLPTLEEHRSCGDRQGPAAFSPDSAFLVCCDPRRSAELAVVDLVTGKELSRLFGNSSQPRCCVYTPDGAKIISGCDDGTVRIWKALVRDTTGSAAAHSNYLRLCAFSADGQTLATADDDGRIQLWDANTLDRKSTFTAGPRAKWAIGPDGTILAAVGKGIVRFLDSADGRELAVLTSPSIKYPIWAHCAISPCGHSVVISHDEGHILIWNLKTSEAKEVAESSTELSCVCAYTPDGKWILTSELSGVSVRSARTGIRCGLTLDPANSSIDSICFAVSPRGDFVVTGDGDGRVRIWDWPPDSMTAGGSIVDLLPAWETRASTVRIVSCAVGVGGRIIACADHKGMVMILDSRSGTEIGALPVPGVSCVALHPLKPLLVVGTSAGGVHFAELHHMPSGSRHIHPSAPRRSPSPIIYNEAQQPIRAVAPAPQSDDRQWLERMTERQRTPRMDTAKMTRIDIPEPFQCDKLLAAAERSFLKGNFDAAMTLYGKAFDQGAPAADLASNWVACVLGLFPNTSIPPLHLTRAKAIFGKLVAEGQQSLAVDLDRQIAAHQQATTEPTKHTKPRWKFW